MNGMDVYEALVISSIGFGVALAFIAGLFMTLWYCIL
jgi:hypothetical protein